MLVFFLASGGDFCRRRSQARRSAGLSRAVESSPRSAPLVSETGSLSTQEKGDLLPPRGALLPPGPEHPTPSRATLCQLHPPPPPWDDGDQPHTSPLLFSRKQHMGLGCWVPSQAIRTFPSVAELSTYACDFPTCTKRRGLSPYTICCPNTKKATADLF